MIVSSTRGIYDRSASLTNECEISCFVFCCQMQLSIVLDTLANNKKPYAADNNQKNKTGQYSVKCQKYFRRIRSNIWFTRCNFVASDTNCFSSLFSVACKFLKLCHFISKLLALVIHFSRLRTKINPYLEDLPQADFGGVFETISSIGKEKSRTANYVNWSNPHCLFM